MENSLTASRLKEIAHYDPATGLFTAITKRAGRSPDVGSVLGCPNSAGYLRIMVDGVSYLSHRLAWLYITGHWPDDELDHINGVPTDNRIANLRPATRGENCRNKRRPKHNTSGVKGVSLHVQTGKWVASIQVEGRQFHLGQHATKEAAKQAYIDAAFVMHGSFARVA